MNALQIFLSSRPFGFITEADLPELIKLHRLCQCLVRCGGKRFLCAAQDVAPMIASVIAGGDYIRDVSIASSEIERAAQWQPEPDWEQLQRDHLAHRAKLRATPRRIYPSPWREEECGGAFDGNQITSDSDPGL